MPSLLRPTARWWYDLPDLGDDDGDAPGPALSPALLAEEAEHGVTRDVAWAYAEAMPGLLGVDPMVELWPLAFRRGAMRAAALKQPVELHGLVHVQTRSVEVCRVMGASVPSFAVRDEACVRALLRYGSAVREVTVSHCAPFEVDAPFRVSFSDAGEHGILGRWFESYLAEQFMPVVRLDLEVWLCWDRDLLRPCVVQGHDEVIEGRWGPRDVAPEAEPPPWAEPEAHTLGGEGWATTMLHNHRRGGSSAEIDPGRGWCRLHGESESAYHEALRAAWHAGASLQAVTGPGSVHGTLASVRLDGERAHFAWLGLERVLRLRGGVIEQLTTDHDMRHAASCGELVCTPEMMERLDDFSYVTMRGLPTHAPEEGSCEVAAGDRLVLVSKSDQDALEREAGGLEALALRLQAGSPRDVARWIRELVVHGERAQPVVIVDADASVEVRAPRASAPSPVIVTPRDLIERPAEFHRQHVRLRGMYHHAMEVSVFADAWFTGEPTPGYGVWLVEAEGLWLHEGEGHGHFGQYASELRGTMRAVDCSRARPVAADRIRFARRYVPLCAEVMLERHLCGWTLDGRWMTRLGPDARLPTPEVPESCRARVKFSVGMSGNIGLLAWELLDAVPLIPERVTAAAPGPRARYIEIAGQLAPAGHYLRLDGTLEVKPPSLLRVHTIPEPADLQRFCSVLGAGRHVTVRGEMDGARLLAISITDESGSVEL